MINSIQDTLLGKFSAAFSMNIELYHNSGLVKAYLEDRFTPNPAQLYMLPYVGSQHKVCFLISPEYLLCGLIQLKHSNHYLIIGPAVPYELTSQQLDAIRTELAIPTALATEFSSWLYTLPHFNASAFRHILDLIYTVLDPNSSESPIHVSYKIQHTHLLYEQDFHTLPTMNSLVEDEMIHLISYGKTEELINYFDSLPTRQDIHFHITGSHALRGIKNIFIGAVVITSRAARDGGLDYPTSILLSDFYLGKVEKLSLFTDIMELMRSMFIDFTRRVALCTRPDSDSEIVSRIYRDIQLHLHTKVSVKDISSRLSMDRTYLCHHFKEKTGKTLTQYIHEQKIKEAAYLIETSDLSLAVIADRLAFSSQQQFQKIFKQVTGITPGKY